MLSVLEVPAVLICLNRLKAVPPDERRLWISARHSPVYALIGDMTVYMLGGYEAHDRIIDYATQFEIFRGPALPLLNSIRTEGAHMPGGQNVGVRHCQWKFRRAEQWHKLG